MLSFEGSAKETLDGPNDGLQQLHLSVENEE